MRPPSSMASRVPGAICLRDNRFQLEREYRECGFGSAGTRDPHRRDAGAGRGKVDQNLVVSPPRIRRPITEPP
jgi:hypothetical protein